MIFQAGLILIVVFVQKKAAFRVAEAFASEYETGIATIKDVDTLKEYTFC